MGTNQDFLTLMRKVSLFSTVTGDDLSRILKEMSLTSFPRGAMIVDQGSNGDAFYLIVSGNVELTKKENDIEKSLALVGRGDALGEMSILTGEPFGYAARAESTVNILILHKNDFDKILNNHPAIGVSLSRTLSHRLAAMNKEPHTLTATTKLISLLTGLPYPDQVLFSVNLAMSVLEQTRQKVLLLCVEPDDQLTAKSLRLNQVTITKKEIQSGFLRDASRFDQGVMVHPSGLEILSLSSKAFFEDLGHDVSHLIDLIKEKYDICLLVLPPQLNDVVQFILNESTRVITVLSDLSRPEQTAAVRTAELTLSPSKSKERIWLTTEGYGIPSQIPPGNRIPWKKEWAREYRLNGSVFIPSYDRKTQRKLDRLARLIGQLLIGFAMGSGAAFGYSIIGMLRVFEREGIFPDVITGTSMGALIGGFYVAGYSPQELEDIACSISKKRLWRMMELALPRSGVLTGRGILKFLRSYIGDKTFLDADVPFACVSTDIETGREIVLDKGNIAEAVRASLSLPFFFQPYYHDGRYLVDGGLVNPVPTSIIMSQGANILLSANLTSKPGDRKVPPMMLKWKRKLPALLRGPSIPEILVKTMYTMQYEISSARAETAHVVLDFNAKGLWWWDLDEAKGIIELGEASAEENMPKIKSLLPYFADHCKFSLNRRARKMY